eukprot:1589357-Amphidinium_carterae.1
MAQKIAVTLSRFRSTLKFHALLKVVYIPFDVRTFLPSMSSVLDLAMAGASLAVPQVTARPGNRVDANSIPTSCNVALSTVGTDSFPAKKSSPKPVNNLQTMRK